MHTRARMAYVCDVAQKHTVFKSAPVHAVNKLQGQAKPSLHPRKTTPRLKVRQQRPRHLKLPRRLVRVGAEESPKRRITRESPPPRLEKLTLTMQNKKRRRKRNLKNGLKIEMIQKCILLMPSLPILQRILMACLIGRQASPRITKKVQKLQLHAHLHKTLKNLFMTHGLVA